MPGRCRVDQGDRDVPGIPVPDVGAALDIPYRNPLLCQMLHDALAVMLEPVRYQNRLPVGGFDQIFQRLQLMVMDDTSFSVLIVDSAIAHLQQLSCQ